jgi:hypothetical protein
MADLRSLALPPGIYYPKPPAAVLVLGDDLGGGVPPAAAFPTVHDPEGLRQRWQSRFGAILLLVLLVVAVAVVDVDVEGWGLLGVPADPVGGEALAGAEDPGGGVGLVLGLRRLGRLGHEDASGAAGPGGRHGLPLPRLLVLLASVVYPRLRLVGPGAPPGEATPAAAAPAGGIRLRSDPAR